MIALKEGAVVTIDGKTYSITAIDPYTKSVWFQEDGQSNYFSIRVLTMAEITKREKDGSFKMGPCPPKIIGNSYAYHTHDWKTYVGATKVDYYCECGAKKEADWREIGTDTK